MKFTVKEPIFIYIGFMLIVFLSIPILAQGILSLRLRTR